MLRKKEMGITDGHCHTDRLLLHVCSLTKKYPCIEQRGFHLFDTVGVLVFDKKDTCPIE